jgi:hypothetical protein
MKSNMDYLRQRGSSAERVSSSERETLPPDDKNNQKSLGFQTLGIGWKGVVIALGIYISFDIYGGSCGGDAASSKVPHALEDDMDTPVAMQGPQSFENPPTPVGERRHLSSAASASSAGSASSSGSGSSSGHVDHPSQSMGLVFILLLVGQGIGHLTTFKMFSTVQPTVAMFLAGIILTFFLDDGRAQSLDAWLPVENHLWGGSYIRWVSIDHHLLLFAMLPPLLAGDAMAIDVPALNSVFPQCLYLAGPGVVCNSFCVAGFLNSYTSWVYPVDEAWDFKYCLVVASILCATDPVAVVSLLKELGASPTLTVQIQGESLLNDGTAIVMFGIAYRMVQGEEPGLNEILRTLIKMALYAWVVGMFIGAFFSHVAQARS